MLKLIIATIFSLSTIAYGRAPGTCTQVRSDLERVSSKNLMEVLNGFVKASAPSRMIGKPGHEGAKNYLVETIKRFDPRSSGKLEVISFNPDTEEAKKFYTKEFSEKIEGKIPKTNPEYQRWYFFIEYVKAMADKLKNVKGENIVWEKAGLNPKKVLVVSAHYDTINLDVKSFTVNEKEAMPGANYNASGVSVALSLIRTLAQIDLNYTVKVVFLDWQAIGYLGSYQYAKELKEFSGEVLGVVNLEMLGQDTSFLDKTKKTGNMCVYIRDNAQEERWIKKLVEHGNKMGTKVSFEIKQNNFDQSDTFRFWEQNFLGATFSQNWEDDLNAKFYQTSLDTPETLNQETLYGSYKFIGGSVLGTLLDITK